MARNNQLPPDFSRHKERFPNPEEPEKPFGCRDKKCLAGEPDDDWRIWLLMTGRGWGKTATGANWIVSQAMKYPNTKWGVAAPTANDLFKTCFNGDSGIRQCLLPGEEADFNINRNALTLSNGSEIHGYSIDQPNRIRGANLYGLWLDEGAAARYIEEFYQMTALPAVRKGEGRIVMTTTPQNIPFLRNLIAEKYGKVHITRGFMWENTSLSARTVEDMRKSLGRTRIGRQELEGELLDDFEGALFSRKDLDRYRIPDGDKVPQMSRIVIGFDPAMKSGEESDESGIVVVGTAEMEDGFEHAFILDDRSMKGSPNECAQAVASAARAWGVDCVYYEPNQGGDWIRDTLKSIDTTIPTREAHSSRGKIMRAQPVSNLCEMGRIHMVGVWMELEDELCIMRPNAKSKGGDDDRSDAMIHAIWGLGLVSYGSWVDAYGQRRCQGCEKLFNRDRVSCPNCGTVNQPAEMTEVAKMKGSWADAYFQTCRKCGSKFAKNRKCPGCNMSAEIYLAQVAAFGGGGNSNVYSGKDWFRGRKI